jgi:hypothetical protein
MTCFCSTIYSINQKYGKQKRKRITKDIPLDLMHYNRYYLWFSESISLRAFEEK